jgi:hypothetical protein
MARTKMVMDFVRISFDEGYLQIPLILLADEKIAFVNYNTDFIQLANLESLENILLNMSRRTQF